MAKKEGCNCGWFLDDWFYSLLAILLGLVLLGVNIGWLDPNWVAYWPVLLILIGGKELIERN